MYFVIVLIAAFAILLSDGLPPSAWNLLAMAANALGHPQWSARLTFGIVAAQMLLIVVVACWVGRRALQARDGTPEGDARLEDRYALAGFLLPMVVAVSVVSSFLLTGWLELVRAKWGLVQWPVAADLLSLAPFLLATVLAWACLYPADHAVRRLTLAYHPHRPATDVKPWSLAEYLLYRIRHQILTVLVPMVLVLAIKHRIDVYHEAIVRAVRIPWAADALLGLVATGVLLISPILLRYLWSTRPLPNGALRERLEQLSRRIGMRYRDILVWESHGLTVNAAVMGLFAPVRYILLTDGLLATMDERQIEAVFGHEAGHVRRHHLLYFGIFAILSILIVGGALEILVHWKWRFSREMEQLISLLGMLLVWGPAFVFISQKFERQADLFGTRCVTGPEALCESDCVLHAEAAGATALEPSGTPVTGEQTARDGAICSAAARLFGKTLRDVARYNGIPLETRSWRHGSIQSRCDLLARFAHDPASVRQFERTVAVIQATLIILTLVGCLIAAWLYWPSLSPPARL